MNKNKNIDDYLKELGRYVYTPITTKDGVTIFGEEIVTEDAEFEVIEPKQIEYDATKD